METHQQTSCEEIIPVLEHGQLHFGSGCVSELNIIITIAISPRASLQLAHGPHYYRVIKPRLLWKRTMKSCLKY